MIEKRILVKRQILKELKRINERPKDPLSVTLHQQHEFWNRSVGRFSKQVKKYLINIEAVKIYALKHPKKVQADQHRFPSLAQHQIHLQHGPPREEETR